MSLDYDTVNRGVQLAFVAKFGFGRLGGVGTWLLTLLAEEKVAIDNKGNGLCPFLCDIERDPKLL